MSMVDNEMHTADASKRKRLDSESIKDFVMICTVYAILKIETNEIYHTSNNVTVSRDKLIDQIDELKKTIHPLDYEIALESLSKLNLAMNGDKVFHKELLSFYMMFITFNEKATVNANLDERIRWSIDVKYLKVCEVIMDDKTTDSIHEEQMWLLANDLYNIIKDVK